MFVVDHPFLRYKPEWRTIVSFSFFFLLSQWCVAGIRYCWYVVRCRPLLTGVAIEIEFELKRRKQGESESQHKAKHITTHTSKGGNTHTNDHIRHTDYKGLSATYTCMLLFLRVRRVWLVFCVVDRISDPTGERPPMQPTATTTINNTNGHTSTHAREGNEMNRKPSYSNAPICCCLVQSSLAASSPLSLLLSTSLRPDQSP